MLGATLAAKGGFIKAFPLAVAWKDRHIKRMKYLPFLILLAACTMAPQPPTPPKSAPLPSPAADTCNAAKMQSHLGKPVSSLETTLLLQPVRIIRPDQAVTMDFLENRINFIADADDIITSISCG